MPVHHSLKPRKFQIELRTSETSSVHGGQLAISGLLRQSGFFDWISDYPALDHRKDPSRGYDPAVYITASLYSFCSGGGSLSDVEELNSDKALLKLLGIRKIPDQSALGEWLRALDEAGRTALKDLNRRLCTWILRQTPRDKYCYGGTEEEWFFDDTQIEVTGKKFEHASHNYNGDVALGWQTLWRGPLILECELAGQGGVGECFGKFCRQSSPLRQEGAHYLYADSGSSNGNDLTLASKHFTRHSISYNKWTGPLDRAAEALSEESWGASTLEHWRGGQKHLVSHGWVKHQPSGCGEVRLFAALRHKREGEMFWQYCFTEVEEGRGTTPAQSRAAFERHRLKGECERRFSEVLGDMGLHRPPCHSLGANDAWYTLGAMGYNILTALKLLVLPERDLAKRPRTIMQRLLLLPMELKSHARQLKAVIYVCAERLRVWREIFAEWLPDHRLSAPPARAG